jgi:deazaflavin-dependent oxidoreductase (nitroreductase family)
MQRPSLRRLLRAPIWLYRARLGWLLGHRFVYVAHRGRVSGARREVVLEVIERDRQSGAVTVVSAWGPKAQWFRNLQAHPPLEIRLGRERIPAPRQEFLSVDEGWALLRRYAVKHPRTARSLAKMLGVPIDAALHGRVDPSVSLPAVRFTPS